MLRFRSLGSGSTGNATLIEAHGQNGRVSRLLVDCGFALRQLESRLQRVGLSAADLDALFVTHEHSDHVGCAHALSKHHSIPVWMSQGTWMASGERDYGALLQRASDGVLITIGELQVLPFTVPHDAREPLQLRCTNGQRTLGLLTDLGHASPHVMAHLQGLHALLLESNHDSQMLARSTYPAFLKQRVGGPLGHLSNDAAAQIARAVAHPGLKQVLAAHLSHQNNRPELVRASLGKALGIAPSDVLTATAAEGSDWLEV